MWSISKKFDFCYGHRVWTQTLDPDLSCHVPCACRHLHGHQGQIEVELYSKTLQSHMVTDFHHLNWFKKFVDTYFDHKMILDRRDPALRKMLGSYDWDHRTDIEQFWIPIAEGSNNVFWIPNTTNIDVDTYVLDILAGLVVVPFVPTSESLAHFFWKVVDHKMVIHSLDPDKRVRVGSVFFRETPKSQSVYSAPHEPDWSKIG